MTLMHPGFVSLRDKFTASKRSPLTSGLTLLTAVLFAITPLGSAQVSSINYFPVAVQFIYAPVAGSDGAIWFVAYGAIGRITLSGQITTFPIFFNGSIPSGYITPGADGALWFTDSGTNAIGRICIETSKTCQATGDITEYPIPTAQSGPNGITSGADGAIWFAEQSANNIGRIDIKTGIVSEYPVGLSPREITAGSDGQLWFTASENGSVGRLSTAGILTPPYQIPNSYPYSITTGSDGALWFTDLGTTSLIRRLTTSGNLSEFVAPVPNPGEITSGPDGSLWFIGENCPFECTSILGRMTTSGAGSSFSIASYAQYIASGPDGSLWATMNEAGIPSIAQIVPSLRRNGIDLSASAGVPPPSTLQLFSQAGIQYAVVKSPQTGGTLASQQVTSLFNAGIGVGTYCYLDLSTSAQPGSVQAKQCLATVSGVLNQIRFMALDVEDTTSPLAPLNRRMSIIDDAANTILSTGLKVAIYTNGGDWTTITNGTTSFGSYPLWNAAHGSFANYSDPAGNLGCTTGSLQSYAARSLTPLRQGGTGVASLAQFTPFGGWLNQAGTQYNVGGGFGVEAACLLGTQVDFDVFDPSLFE